MIKARNKSLTIGWRDAEINRSVQPAKNTENIKIIVKSVGNVVVLSDLA